MDATCVLGGVGCMFIVRTLVVDREVLFLPSSLRTRPQPSRLRGSGLEKEVKLRGGASGLQGERTKERQWWICREEKLAVRAIGSRINCMRVFAIGSRKKAAPKGRRNWMRSVCLLLERNDEWESRSAV